MQLFAPRIDVLALIDLIRSSSFPTSPLHTRTHAFDPLALQGELKNVAKLRDRSVTNPLELLTR